MRTDNAPIALACLSASLAGGGALLVLGVEIPVAVRVVAAALPIAPLAWLVALLRRRAVRDAAGDEETRRLRGLVAGLARRALFLVDGEDRIATWSAGARDLLRWEEEEIVGQPLARLYRDADAAVNAPASDLQLARERGIADVEGWRQRRDGSRIWARCSIARAEDPAESGGTCSILIVDATRPREAEDARAETESRLRSLVEMTTDYSYVLVAREGSDLGIDWVSGEFRLATGYEPEELTGVMGGLGLVHPEDIPIAARRLRRLAARESDTSEFRILTKGGDVRWIRETGRPTWDVDRGELRIVCAATDITGQRSAEETARRQQAEVTRVLSAGSVAELISSFRHDLRQPLAAIVNYARGSARRLRSGSGDPAALLHPLEEIADQAMRANDLLDRNRGWRNELVPDPEPLDAGKVLRETVSLLRGDFAQRSVQAAIEIADDLPPVLADRPRIEQVVLNLCRNAIEAMDSVARDERRLRVSAIAAPGGCVEIAIDDTGPGIPPESSAMLFRPFFTTKPGALGMGLVISRSIVHSLGGRLHVESGPQGASARFTLPAPGEVREVARPSA